MRSDGSIFIPQRVRGGEQRTVTKAVSVLTSANEPGLFIGEKTWSGQPLAAESTAKQMTDQFSRHGGPLNTRLTVPVRHAQRPAGLPPPRPAPPKSSRAAQWPPLPAA